MRKLFEQYWWSEEKYDNLLTDCNAQNNVHIKKRPLSDTGVEISVTRRRIVHFISLSSNEKEKSNSISSYGILKDTRWVRRSMSRSATSWQLALASSRLKVLNDPNRNRLIRKTFDRLKLKAIIVRLILVFEDKLCSTRIASQQTLLEISKVNET